jgi:hypothetical protein
MFELDVMQELFKPYDASREKYAVVKSGSFRGLILVFSFLGRVRLCPLGTSAIIWHILPVPNNRRQRSPCGGWLEYLHRSSCES